MKSPFRAAVPIANVFAFLTVFRCSIGVDWRSLSQVKELGVMVVDCAPYAKDVSKVFDTYWLGAVSTTLPVWPASTYTQYNEKSPMVVGVDNTAIYVAAGPKTFAPEGRTDETEAILNAINGATKFLKFEVMDYTPTTMYFRPNTYWGPIDDALRAAALRGVQVNLLFSIWNHTNPTELPYWRSLNAINNIKVLTFQIPDSPYTPPAPYTRVSHSKFIITDQRAYVTTSNCGADYYLYTGGVSSNILSTTSEAYQTINTMFDWDWNSSYAKPIPDRLPRRGPGALPSILP